jgi:hypothetical protein
MEFTTWRLSVQREPLARFQGYEAPLTKELLADLSVMVDEFHASAPGDPVGPIVLDLPDLDQWGGATSLIFEHLLKPRLVLPGGDEVDRRVRILATYRDNRTEMDEPGRLLREQAGPRVDVLSVDPFSPEEERLAIPWVLLHPYGEWNEVIVPSRDAKAEDWYETYRRTLAYLAKNLDKPLKSSPECFNESAFASTINYLREERHLRSDDYSDASLLVGLGEAT